jgi:hypothetical protein
VLLEGGGAVGLLLHVTQQHRVAHEPALALEPRVVLPQLVPRPLCVRREGDNRREGRGRVKEGIERNKRGGGGEDKKHSRP